MEIEIIKNRYDQLFATDAESNYLLFQFEFRKKGMGAWYFWLRGDNDPDVFEGKQFPLRYFKNACRAKNFIITCGTNPCVIDEDVEIVKGENYLKV